MANPNRRETVHRPDNQDYAERELQQVSAASHYFPAKYAEKTERHPHRQAIKRLHLRIRSHPKTHKNQTERHRPEETEQEKVVARRLPDTATKRDRRAHDNHCG